MLSGKLLLGAYIGYVGGGVVLRSPDNFALVMNSLATGFIMELDDFAFRFFLPSTLRVFLTAAIEKPFGKAAEESGMVRSICSLAYTPIVGALLSALVATLYRLWC